MIPRYSRSEMSDIWSAENRYRIWWQIEVFAAEAMGRIGMIPADDAATIRAAYDGDVLGEIDIDSDRRAAFGADDRALLEPIAALLAERLSEQGS